MKHLKKSIITSALLFSITAFADDHAHEHREHSAHVHGKAKLNILIDSSTVAVELESPALNLLGFEHKPKTDEEKARITEVNNMLASYTSIFSIPSATCQQTEASIEAPYGHDDSHDEHHEHGHEDDHHHDDDDHAEYHLTYTLNCKGNVGKIEMKVFDNFSGFENIDAQWLGSDGAGADTLTQSNKLIKLN